jgi:hypothetical protein
MWAPRPNPTRASSRTTCKLLACALAATFAPGCFHPYTDGHFEDYSYQVRSDRSRGDAAAPHASVVALSSERADVAPIVNSAQRERATARANARRRRDLAMYATVGVLVVASVASIIAGAVVAQNSNWQAPTWTPSGGGGGGANWGSLFDGHSSFVW